MLRKTISAGLAICMVFFLCSCEKTPNKTEPQEHQEDVSFISVMLGDKNIEEWNENNVIANVSWNSLKLPEEEEAKFPDLKKTFSKHNDDALKNAKSTMYELVEAAEDLSGDEFNPLYLEGTTKTYVQRADTKIVSYLEDIYVYSGGVHPDYYYKTVNLYKFSRHFSETHYVPFLDAYQSALGQNEYYEQVLRVITMLDEPVIKAKR